VKEARAWRFELDGGDVVETASSLDKEHGLVVWRWRRSMVVEVVMMV
jgi:hypothetical protein